MRNEKKNNTSSPHQHRSGHSFYAMMTIAFIMCLLMFVLTAVAKNVTYASADPVLELLDVEKAELEQSFGESDCLLLYENDAMGNMGYQEMSAILSQMRIRFDALECTQASADMLEDYHYLVLSVTHYQYLGDLLGTVKTWVKSGGNLMILYPPEINGNFQSLFDILGIRDCGNNYVLVESLRFSQDFLLGGSSRDYPIIDAYESSMGPYLEDDCQIFAQTE